MTYHISKTIDGVMDGAVDKVTEALKGEVRQRLTNVIQSL